MRFIKSYKIFESTQSDLQKLARDFLKDYSINWDLRLAEPFDRELANCAWFSKEFFNWAKKKGIDCKLVYFDHPTEAHIAPLIDGMTIDFTVKQFTNNPQDDYLILKPEDYKNWGYPKWEILEVVPDFLTIREPKESYR